MLWVRGDFQVFLKPWLVDAVDDDKKNDPEIIF